MGAVGEDLVEVNANASARLNSLEEIARELTQDQLNDLAAVIRQEKEPLGAWPADERDWFSGRGGANLSSDDDRAVRRMWTRLQVGLTFAVTGIDIDPPADRRTKKRGWLARILGPEHGVLEGEAATLLERHGGGGIWLPITGVWNAFCAALLLERLDPELRFALEKPWRLAIGMTPRERLAAIRP